MHGCNELLSSLYERGVRLWTENGQVHFQVPKGKLHPEELDKLRMFKSEIVKLLQQAQVFAEEPIQPRPSDCLVPLMSVQRGIWDYYMKQNRELSERFCAVSLRVCGALNIPLLQKSIEAVVARHESLRTRFVAVDGVPRQHIDPACEFHLEVIEPVATSPASIAEEVDRLVHEFYHEKVDISVGPLFAAKLFRISDSEHVLLLTIEHIISDGVSLAILGREVWTLYDQALRGLPLRLPPLLVQLGDYAVWQHKTYDTWQKKHEAYWKERLRNAPRLELPRDEGAVEVTPVVSEILRFSFGHVLSARVREVARRERTFPALVVLTFYLAVMSRWYNQRDLMLVFISHGRNRPELANVIGFLVEFLYLRIEVSPEDRFIDLLKRVHSEFHSASYHQPFDPVQDLAPDYSTDLSFNWQPSNWAPWLADRQWQVNDQVTIRPYPLKPSIPAQFGQWFFETSDDIDVTVLYSSDSYSSTTIEQFRRELLLFAENCTQHPLTRVASISMKSGSMT